MRRVYNISRKRFNELFNNRSNSPYIKSKHLNVVSNYKRTLFLCNEIGRDRKPDRMTVILQYRIFY